MSPIILIGMFSLVSTGSIPSIYLSKIFDDIVTRINELFINHDLRNMSLPDVANGNFLTQRRFTSGYVYDLSTIKRIGDANMTSRLRGYMKELSIQAPVGLETLVANYHYNIKFLWTFENSGHMTIRVKKNSALAKIVIITDQPDGICVLLSKNLDVILFDDIDVSIQERGFISNIVAKSVKYGLHNLTPNIIKMLNIMLDNFNDKYLFNQELEKYVCKYFV